MNAEQFSASGASGGGGSAIKAWAKFTASSGAILAQSGGVSITRNGTGDFSITLSTAMSSANYAVLTSHRAGAAGQGTTFVDSATSQTTTTFKLLHRRYDNAAVDPVEIYFACLE